jgi:hypothetical protein
MIVRRKGDHFVLIKQHDHALVSGEFAAHMSLDIEPLSKVLHAISNHDIGWEELDHTVLWNEDKQAPYSFEDYPLLPKLEAYTSGISRVEEVDPYAGFLCSKHYASFFDGAENPAARRFRRQEESRQNQLRRHFTPAEEQNLEVNFRLLQFCDDLSLAICLNEPGENSHPWYAGGIRFLGETYRWIWENERSLRLEPNLFVRPFVIEIPYRVADVHRQLVGQDVYRFEVVA